MTETVEGNTIRAETISYDFNTHRWNLVYSSGDRIHNFQTREVGESATLQEVFNLLIIEIKGRKHGQ